MQFRTHFLQSPMQIWRHFHNSPLLKTMKSRPETNKRPYFYALFSIPYSKRQERNSPCDLPHMKTGLLLLHRSNASSFNAGAKHVRRNPGKVFHLRAKSRGAKKPRLRPGAAEHSRAMRFLSVSPLQNYAFQLPSVLLGKPLFLCQR